MDPKKYANLDPKLKEAYERVMGTKVPSVTPPTQPKPQVTVTAPKPVIPQSPQPIAPPTPTAQKPVSPIPIPKPSGIAVNATSKSKIFIILFILGGILFFVGYTFFWVKFFNIPLPFTLPF